jgi:hypothetical protein
MHQSSNVIASAVVALPVMGIAPGAQASIAARLRQFGGLAVAIMIFIYFGMRVALAADTTDFHTVIAPVENETYFHQNNATYFHQNNRAAISQGVNNAGVIVGEVDDSNGIKHGFYFRDGAVSEFDSPGATDTVANGINAGDVIVGSRFDATNGWQAFFASPGVSNNFKYPNSTHTFAGAINDNNVIVGSFTNGAGNWSGWWYYNGQSGLLQFPGAVSTVVNSINNSNLICGYATGRDGHQFGFYRPSNLVYTAFSAPGATDTVCTGVSDDNQLVGYYRLADGSNHGFVAGPGPGKFTTVVGPGSTNTIIQSIMPNGVSLVGLYTINNITYSFVTGNAGWPVNRQISPLAGNSFIGSDYLLSQGISYAFALNFHADGSVVYHTNRTTTTSPGCSQDDTYDWSGSFYVQSLSLHLVHLQGQHKLTDSCNPALNTQYPAGPIDDYLIQWWEVGTATDATTQLFVYLTGNPILDDLLLVKD